MHCVDLGESFQTHIFLQNLASIQPRTSPLKFARSTGAEDGRRQASVLGSVIDGIERIGRSGKIDRARSRLYRSQILQENMRLKALAEIYTMHSFAQL